MSSDYREKARATFLALIMVTSVMAAGVAFTGSAAADAPPDSTTDSPGTLQVSLLNESTGTVNATWGVNTTSGTINVANGSVTDQQVADIDPATESAKAIQFAIDNATTEYSTVRVGPGTYNSSGAVLINIGDLTIEGPNAGLAGDSDQRGAEATINGKVNIGGTDNSATLSGEVVIDGIKIATTDGGVTDGVISVADRGEKVENVTINNSVIDTEPSSVGVGIYIEEVDNLSIENNEFTESGSGTSVAVNVAETAISTLEISENTLTDVDRMYNEGDGFIQGRGITSTTVRLVDNNVTGASTAIGIGDSEDALTSVDYVISGNQIEVSTVGILQNGGTPASFTIENNEFTGDSSTIYVDDSKNKLLDLSAILNDQGNTFDRAVTVENSSGDIVVNKIHGGIQPAVNDASSDETVVAEPGTYNESVSISTANVTLESTAGADVTEINASTDSGFSGAVSDPVVSITADNVTVSGFTLVDEVEDNQAIHLGTSSDDATLSDNDITTQVGPSPGTFVETVQSESNPTGIEIVNNTFTQEGVTSGVLVRGVYLSGGQDHLVDNNEFEGLNVSISNWGNNTVISSNTFTNNTDTTVHISDDAGLDTVTIEGNDFTNVGDGVAFVKESGGYGADANLAVNNNNFEGVEGYAVYTADGAFSVTDIDATVDATSNWWGSTDGPSGDFNGHGVAATGAVSVDPATVDSGEIDLTTEFAGVVKDSASSLTVADDEDAGFKIEDIDAPANGTLVVDIAGQEYVFEDALDNGEVVETDSSENASTDIAATTETGTTNISVAGNGSTTAIEQAGTVNLVHEARNAPRTGYFLTSMPQSGDLVYQGIDDISQWDGVDNEYQSFDDSKKVDSVHRGIYMNATSADARYGFTYDTDPSEVRAQVGSKELDEGWHVLSSNYNISDTTSTELQTDLSTQANPDSSDLVVYDDQVTSTLGDKRGVSPYEAYYVYVHAEDDRPVVLPVYNATAR